MFKTISRNNILALITAIYLLPIGRSNFVAAQVTEPELQKFLKEVDPRVKVDFTRFLKATDSTRVKDIQKSLQDWEDIRSHTIEVPPGYPPSIIYDNWMLMDATEQSKLPKGWDRKMLSVSVLFKQRTVGNYANYTLGNGVMISPTAILTARHVAESVDKAPNMFAILVLSDGASPNSFIRLQYNKVEYLENSDDPDLAVVRVVNMPRSWFPTIDFESVNTKDNVFLLGCGELGDLPKLGSGFVTTKPAKRKLKMLFPMTFFGTTLFSFAGQSGSPVYRSDTGNLIGIFSAGPKWWAKSGESVIKAPLKETDWDSFQDWSFVAPVNIYADRIRK